MARHYSTRSFFRQIPNDLLARYFEGQALFGELDFATMKETRPDELFRAWLELPEEQRNAMDAAFREIFEMSCEKGVWAILDEARWQWRDALDALTAFVETLSALPNHYHRAMVTSMDYPDFWRGATRFYHADVLPYWRKHKHLGHQPAAVDTASLEQLATLIRAYFHHTEGRGNNCVVEAFRRNELDYFFAYPEDYSQQQIEWVNGAFGRRPHNPAFEVIFVYSQQEGSLDVNFRGPYRAVEPLQEMFARAILKLRLPPDPTDQRGLRSQSATPEGIRVRLRRGQRDRKSGGEETAVVFAGEKGRPDHGGSGCLHPSRCGLRPAGEGRRVHPSAPLQRHSGGAGGCGGDGCGEPGPEGAGSPDLPQFLLAQVRRAGSEAAGDAGSLGHRTQGTVGKRLRHDAESRPVRTP